MTGLDFHADGRRADFPEEIQNRRSNLFRLLIWDQPAGYFGPSPGRNDRLAPLPLVTTRQAVDFEGGSRAALLVGGKAAVAKQLRHAEEFCVFASREIQPGNFR